jgi:hypothetical protein
MEPTANGLCFIPASGAEHLELGVLQPLIRGRAAQRNEVLFTFSTPSIRSRGIGFRRPEEPNALASIDSRGNVHADEANALLPVNWAHRDA